MQQPADVTTTGDARPLIVCPLRFERNALLKAGVSGEVVCCGPGDEAVRVWAETVGPTDRPVVLAGLAGGLTSGRTEGTAHVVTEVRDDGGTTRIPIMRGRGARCVATSTRTLVVGPDAKRDLHRRLGADVVDQESVAFAVVAGRQGWRWGIVRGIGDGVDRSLPAGLGNWVDTAGRVRPLRVAGSVIRRPALVATLAIIRGHGLAALRAVAGELGGLLEREAASPWPPPGARAEPGERAGDS